MPSVTKMVNNRLITSQKVAKAIELYGPQCIPQAENILCEGKLSDETPNLTNLLNTMSRQMQRTADLMVDADIQVQTEHADDPAARELRDKSVASVRSILNRFRKMISTVYGDNILSNYSLDNDFPANPDFLATYTKGVIELLRNNPFPSESIDDILSLDAHKLADSLSKKLATLEQALDNVKTEAKELLVAINERNLIVEKWQNIYSCTASVASSIFKLADRYDLAGRVRPSVRKESGAVAETDIQGDENSEKK